MARAERRLPPLLLLRSMCLQDHRHTLTLFNHATKASSSAATAGWQGA